MSSTVIVHLTDATMTALRREYASIMVPDSSRDDLVNALLQRHVKTVHEARLVMEQQSPVTMGCD